MKHVGGEIRQIHWRDIGYTIASRDAIAAVAGIIPLDASMFIHGPMDFRRYGYVDGPPILGFGFVVPQPTPTVAPQLPTISLEPFQRSLDERTTLLDRPRVELDDDVDLLRVRCLQWLATTLRSPVAYWHHMGDHGLVNEYAWCFGGAAEAASVFYNEDESVNPDCVSDRPASALTACFRHLRVQFDNVTEARWMHDHLTYRVLTERPFCV